MGFDRGKMAARRKAAQARRDNKKGGYLTIPEGHNLYFVCPGTENTDDMPWIEVDIHFKVGPDKKACVCLSHDNPVWKDEAFLAYLKAAGIEAEPGECAVCNAIAGNEGFAGGADPSDMEAKTRSIWVLAPVAVVNGGQRELLPPEAQVPRLYMGSTKIGDEIVDVLEAEGDITDPTQATLIRISRKGTGFKDTRYQPVSADGETLRTPMKLSKPLRAAIARDVVAGGDCDIAQVVGRMCRPLNVMRALLNGEQVQQQQGGGDGKPSCYGSDFDAEDTDCTVDCKHGRACAKACGEEFPGKAETKPPKQEPKKPAPEDDGGNGGNGGDQDFEATASMVTEVLGNLFADGRKAKDARAMLAPVLEETGDDGPEKYTKKGIRSWLEDSSDDEDLWGELLKMKAPSAKPKDDEPSGDGGGDGKPSGDGDGGAGFDDELEQFEKQLKNSAGGGD